MRFKPGQPVTLRKSANGWTRQDTQSIHPYGPTFGQIVHVDFYNPFNPAFMCFVEYPLIDSLDNDRHYYWEKEFEAVISDEVLLAELEIIPEPFTT